MKAKKFFGSVALSLITAMIVLTGCNTGTNPDTPDADTGPIDYPFDGVVFENETLPIFNYDILLMNGNAVMGDIDIDLADDSDASAGVAMMMDFCTSKDTNGGYVWNGVTFSLDQLAFNPIDLSAYGAMTFKVKMVDNADSSGDMTIEKVGFGLGSDYEIHVKNYIKVSAYDVWEQFIVPIPDSSQLTSVSNLLFFADSATTPDKVYIDDVKFIAKDDLSVTLIGSGADNSGGANITKNLATGNTDDLNALDADWNRPFWINMAATDIVGTWKNVNYLGDVDGTLGITGNLARFFTWASDNETAAIVSETGVVSGVSAGTANITATLGGQTLTFAYTVAEPVPFAGIIHDDTTPLPFVKTLTVSGGSVPMTDDTTVFNEGSSSIKIDFTNIAADQWGGTWGGVAFESASPVDLSSYTTLKFDIRSEAALDSILLKVEDIGANSAYPPDYSTFHEANSLSVSLVADTWTTISIDLSSISNTDLSFVDAIGFWHPKISDVFQSTVVYLDNIHFE